MRLASMCTPQTVSPGGQAHTPSQSKGGSHGTSSGNKPWYCCPPRLAGNSTRNKTPRAWPTRPHPWAVPGMCCLGCVVSDSLSRLQVLILFFDSPILSSCMLIYSLWLPLSLDLAGNIWTTHKGEGTSPGADQGEVSS